MSKFISGKLKAETNGDLFGSQNHQKNTTCFFARSKKLFSMQAANYGNTIIGNRIVM